MWTFALIVTTVAFIYYLFNLYINRNSDVWIKQKIPFLNNTLSIIDILSGRSSIIDLDVKFYEELGDEKFGGALELGTPLFFVKDLELAKAILIKDIDYFFDRRDFARTDVLVSEGLFFLEGQKWKDMRAFLSPTFTSGKIRRMFRHFDESSKKMLDFMKSQRKESKTSSEGFNVAVPEVMQKFALEVIASAAFGMDSNCFKDTDSLFYKMAVKLGIMNIEGRIRFGIFQTIPKLANVTNMQVLTSDVSKFFRGLLSSALKIREKSSNPSDDFLQLLVEARRGDMQVDESELNDFEREGQIKTAGGKRPKLHLTEAMAMGQGFVFLIAGLDTISANLNVATYVLAVHPEIQEKIYREVGQVIQSTGGKINYDAVNRMEYLEMFVSEVLRLYPAISRIERKCMKDYCIPGTDKVIPKGTLAVFSAEAFQRDEKYFPDPLKFDPERFNVENKAARNPYAYMPFGVGPRNCIGMRFALIETKVALAQIVHNFFVKPTDQTKIPADIKRKFFGYRTEADLELRFVPRKKEIVSK